MTTLPEWMCPRAAPDTWVQSPLPTVRVTRRGVTRRTLNGLARILATLLADDAVAGRHGLLQGIDPRAKTLGLLGLLVVVTLVHRLEMLALAYGACVLLAILSRVPARRFAGMWLAAPLLTAAIILPATLNLVTPGAPVWVLGHASGRLGPWSLPSTLAVTDAGLLLAGRFVLRSVVCVSLALLLAVTTRPARLFHGLRVLGVPQLFVMLLSMMERYLGVLARAAEEIHAAKLSRSIAADSLRREQAWVAAGMGALYRRTQSLGHAVYLAMLSRGYTGEVHRLDEPRWRRRDSAFLAGAILFAVLLIQTG